MPGLSLSPPLLFNPWKSLFCKHDNAHNNVIRKHGKEENKLDFSGPKLDKTA